MYMKAGNLKTLPPSIIYAYAIIVLIASCIVIYQFLKSLPSPRGPEARMETFADGEGSTGSITMFHSPGCGHCKSAMPAFDQLAAEYSKPGDKRCIVNKVNGEQNSADVERYGIKGFPTYIYHPKSSDKNTFSEYGGGRDYRSLKNYIEYQRR